MNFFARYKKIFLILGFLGLVFLVGYLLWRVFFLAETVLPTATTTPGIISGLPTAGPGGETTNGTTEPGALPAGTAIPIAGAPDPNEPNTIAVGGLTKTTAVTQSPTVSPTLSSDGQVQYYNKDDGLFYKIDENGQAVLLSDKVFHNVENVVWAPTKDKAIIEYPDGNKILYNFSTKKQVTLPSYWEDFSFAPASDKIVSKSLGLDAENRWLMVSNDDGSQAKALENIGTNDKTVYPSWSPNNQVAAMYTKGVDFNRQEVFFIGLNGENFKSTVVEGRGFESQWSTTGDRLLYSVYNSADDMKPRLWIVDASGDTISQNRKSFDIETWADKCTFASNTEIYCAVPESLEKYSGLLPELAANTKDNLYKIDLTTGAKKLIAVPDGTYNISQIMVPSGQDTLYFTDNKTSQIYQIKLQ
jgi:hypothetical protein